ILAAARQTDLSRPESKQTSDLGLHLLNDRPPSPEHTRDDYSIDVVFVHGLNGHWTRTWTHANGFCWSKDALASDLPAARVYSYGYPSQIIASKSVAGIRDFAKHLLNDLKVLRTEAALILAHQRREIEDVWSQSRAILFMGTPHNGSTYASYGKVLGDLANVAMQISLTHRWTGGVRTSLIKSLEQGNEELRGISEDFCSILEESAIQIVTIYETDKHPLTKKLVRNVLRIVDYSSARLGVSRERLEPLFLNHQQLCQYSGPNDPNYIKILDVIKSFIKADIFEKSSGQMTMASSLYTDYSYDETEKTCASLLNTFNVADYESKLDLRVEGTLEWVLQKPQYSTWSSSSDVRLLWVTGNAGCGKTILASFVSRRLSALYPKSPVCKFFCDEKVDQSHDPLVLLRSLIFQIVNKRRRMWPIVKKATDANGWQLFSQFDALWNLFEQITRSEDKYPIIIIIDAIDEFDGLSQRNVITRIFELLRLEHSNQVKFFFTSRPDADDAVDLQISSLKSAHLSLEDNKEEIDNDIRSVIRYRLERMVRRGTCKPVVRESLERMLAARAEQTFLWIKLILPTIEDSGLLLESEIEQLVNSLPENLTSMYRHLLLSIPKSNQAKASRILRLLVVCDRPLSGEEIGIIMQIGPGQRSALRLNAEGLDLDQKSVQALLGPLVRVHGPYIELVHQSLKEYLLSLSKETSDVIATIFGVDPTRDKVDILKACLMYLSLEEFGYDIYTLEALAEGSCVDEQDSTPTHSSSSFGLDLFDNLGFQGTEYTEEHVWATINAMYHFFDYAALYWASDLAKCDAMEAAPYEDIAYTLCKADSPRLNNWFRYFWYKKNYREPFPTAVDELMVFSFFGHTTNLSRLIQDRDFIDPEALSRALYWAARQGHSSCVQVLLRQPGDAIQSITAMDQAPLLVAAQFGHVECMSLLLVDRRVNINGFDKNGGTALSLAVSNNHNEPVLLLLAYKSIDLNLANNKLNTPLHMAVDAA
ncbi:MAG: hypothetical protein Q9224_004647, partial [Gallowayella concinna]